MVAEAPLRLDGHVAWDEATHWHFEDGTHRLLAKRQSDGEMLAVVCDHLGTPKEMFDIKGKLVWAADHHVWGAIRTARTFGALAVARTHDREPSELQCPWRFPGQYEDAETGLYYNRHRHYDPLTGQYVSPDPIGLAGGDRPQGYVGNPAKLLDVKGLNAVEYNYRGYHVGHPEIENARRGVIKPGDELSNLSPEEHNAGGFSSVSPYTSWTDAISVARRFADTHGPGGVVVKVPRGAPPPGASWKWEFSFDEYMEREILLKGSRNDATIFEER
ncbi:hypothetical protein FY136_14650 [Agrobacterium tumefaciens]|uniref:RHS repeat domain-containing protein n=1 Tax=Agrobacterium tumefaciens TaxID=358 RepID=UPI0021F9C59E|nr:RHS repeat-associated core domain-containing protein [Agrobacterium tumefaciens]UXT50568.1 hypothetical protein FY136_14650 [Agrobacterium tumefaciens]